MDTGLRSLAVTAARRTWEDLRIAFDHVTFSTVGGSFLLPRVARWALYRLGGARMGSAPGARFTLAGSPSLLTVGHDVYFNQGVFIEAVAPVTIGDWSSIGMQSMIITSTHPVDDQGSWQRDRSHLPVVIGDRVWIGARAVVLPGVRVADGCVIASGAVVTKDCPVPGVYGGVPARLIREHPVAAPTG